MAPKLALAWAGVELTANPRNSLGRCLSAMQLGELMLPKGRLVDRADKTR
jgi:hypothetical protein